MSGSPFQATPEGCDDAACLGEVLGEIGRPTVECGSPGAQRLSDFLIVIFP
jgi:hypothetical protein